MINLDFIIVDCKLTCQCFCYYFCLYFFNLCFNESMNAEEGYLFWKRIDAVRGSQSLIDFGKNAGLNYSSLKTMRSRCQMPGISTIIRISELYDVSIDYLLKGHDSGVTAEMAFVRDTPGASMLVRRMMEDPELLDHIVALAVLPGKTPVADMA